MVLQLLLSRPDFSQAFYCGATMPRIDCVALGLDAQRTAQICLRVQTIARIVTTWPCDPSLRNL